MTTKIIGSSGLEFPDSTTQNTAADRGPAFSAKLTGGPQYVTANIYVKVMLDSELFDTNNNFDLALSRFTPTVAGYYQVNASAYMGGSGANGGEVSIYKNGVAMASTSLTIGGAPVMSVSSLIYMNGTTDYIELFGYIAATSGANFDVDLTQMSAFLARKA